MAFCHALEQDRNVVEVAESAEVFVADVFSPTQRIKPTAVGPMLVFH